MNKTVEANDYLTREQLAHIRTMAEQGDAEAQFELGEYYYEASFEEDTDLPYEDACCEAAKWVQNAAEQGIAEAQFRLGNCYGLALGVRYSEEESYKWYRKAADQGLAAGQCAVALHFRFSIKDNEETAKWFLLAAEQGHEFSMKEIAYCYRNGIGVEKNDAEADKWYGRLEESKASSCSEYVH